MDDSKYNLGLKLGVLSVRPKEEKLVSAEISPYIWQLLCSILERSTIN